MKMDSIPDREPQSSPRPQLVLDAGGVLVTNLTPSMWRELADISGHGYGELRDSYKRDIAGRLWTGEQAAPEFYRWIAGFHPDWTEGDAEKLLRSHLLPLPAMDRLPELARSADVHLLSNHVSEWLRPVLEPAAEWLASLTISSEEGLSKPDPALLERCAGKLEPGAPVLFVDDSPRNVAAAEAFGWHALLADDDGLWVDAASERLRAMKL
ncbi:MULTISPECIES: HAD-IA family hydrolase [unclassified Paenibacillus]|uniref:HAD family hydrolase n=1 Tax=unclassified Paenibacillus TaxID=185978 RepID=UPI00095593F8|nr:MULTISPECIES: HAD-IA family hydrolase [unclassified Paenibacillus]ASS68467.1 HAD-IA family hydrolase [Paenibacillus sp. RUD330]SIR34546.1 2-haloacid dehalogenase/putative hydrolase of the HAD superfamily [Paenibacillus sp. RU4X]SIR45278.1 2-haloacid dehalogenase/putative hydrolase of the HAD superfamily [Paenibacillus sp. RU4T]